MKKPTATGRPARKPVSRGGSVLGARRRAKPSGPPLVAVAREAMRTRFEIVIADDRDPVASRAAAEEALEEIGRVESDLSAFREGSALAQLNAEAARHPVAVDAAVFAFLERAGRLTERLQGTFDLTVGALLAELRRGGAGSEAAWDKARALVGFDKHVRLHRAGLTVSFSTPGVQLDPGAIGKGYALERAAALLRDSGVRNALLHGGTSSVYAMGAPPGTKGWGVAVQDPVDDSQQLVRMRLVDQSLSVSAIHGRVFEKDGWQRGHIVDPRTGESVAHTALAAVITESATDADAMSTGLLALGSAGLSAVAQAFPGSSLLCATPLPDNELRIDMSGPAFLDPH